MLDTGKTDEMQCVGVPANGATVAILVGNTMTLSLSIAILEHDDWPSNFEATYFMLFHIFPDKPILPKLEPG